jgi:ABC-type multidrug transport system permease subunit
MKTFQARYVFSAYPMNNAVWSKLLGLHPIVQAKIVMPVINILVINLLFYQIAKALFAEDRKKADLMVALMCVIHLFTDTQHASGNFLLTRTYEGKALLGNLSIMMVLYCAIWFWQHAERNLWVILFLTSLSAVTFSGSSMILIVAIAAGFLPILCMRRQFRCLFSLAVCILPEIAYLILYFSAKFGWIVLRAS